MNSLKKIRVRFAPSPTGFLHIGSLRTALYNYLFAKKNKGDFLLRVEDTDRARFVEGGLENIIKTIDWCGLEYDEGPKLKIHNTKYIIQNTGKYGPYIQSERLEIYQKYAEELVKKGKAYYCTCSPERLETLRQEQMARHEPTRYSGFCRTQNSKLKTQNLLKENKPYVIRLKVPKTGETKFTDIVRGQVSFENKLIDDQVLLKSDGYPTYHLANVVDDHLMNISHVIRGEEWLPSTPKHILLYQAFGWTPPQFAHLPLLLNSDRSKLSKRQGDVAVEDYLKKGYTKEALLNFIALLGWNPKTEQEIFSLKDLIESFKLEDINKAGAIVNFEKLDWMNEHYLRQKSTKELTELCLPYLIEAELITMQNAKCKMQNYNSKCKIIETGEEVDFTWLEQIISLDQERLKKLSDIVDLTAFFFTDLPKYEPSILQWKKSGAEAAVEHLKALIEFLQNVKQEKNNWNKDNLEKIIKDFIEKENLGVGETLWPMRVALSGRQASPPPFELAAILGKEKTLKRLNHAITLLAK
ncbi:MAG: glutamate--tRNA ligase [bacterium]|nr:glutamate--tRNA ligase [bacterium]